MKKLITILMIICIILCSCNNAEVPQTQIDPTPVPTLEVTATPEPTPEPTLEPTDEPTPTEEILTANTTCVMCGRITECQAFITNEYNIDLGMFVDKAYYLCSNCYPIAEANKKEVDNYNELKLALELYFMSDDVTNDYKIAQAFNETTYKNGQYYIKNVDRYVTFDSDGIHFDFGDLKLSDKIKFGLVSYLGKMYFTNMKTNGKTYKIAISKTDGDGETNAYRYIIKVYGKAPTYVLKSE